MNTETETTERLDGFEKEIDELDTLDELLDIMSNKYRLSWDDLPTFGGECPARRADVHSWNKTHVIVGTDINDVGMISRSDWELPPANLEELCERMNNDQDDDYGDGWENLGDYCSLPTFGGDEPDDTDCVWSWDETDIITGRCSGEFEIEAR